MMKPPVVQVAGMHRALRRGVDTESWAWIADLDGQRLFFPPNVAGWDDDRWLDTSTFRGRWTAANYAAYPYVLDTDKWTGKLPIDPDKLVEPRARVLGQPDADVQRAPRAQGLRQDRARRMPTRTGRKRPTPCSS